jgi:hypothetical protein
LEAGLQEVGVAKCSVNFPVPPNSSGAQANHFSNTKILVSAPKFIPEILTVKRKKGQANEGSLSTLIPNLQANNPAQKLFFSFILF